MRSLNYAGTLAWVRSFVFDYTLFWLLRKARSEASNGFMIRSMGAGRLPGRLVTAAIVRCFEPRWRGRICGGVRER